jgi:hypothetical protein
MPPYTPHKRRSGCYPSQPDHVKEEGKIKEEK